MNAPLDDCVCIMYVKVLTFERIKVHDSKLLCNYCKYVENMDKKSMKLVRLTHLSRLEVCLLHGWKYFSKSYQTEELL